MIQILASTVLRALSGGRRRVGAGRGDWELTRRVQRRESEGRRGRRRVHGDLSYQPIAHAQRSVLKFLSPIRRSQSWTTRVTRALDFSQDQRTLRKESQRERVRRRSSSRTSPTASLTRQTARLTQSLRDIRLSSHHSESPRSLSSAGLLGNNTPDEDTISHYVARF